MTNSRIIRLAARFASALLTWSVAVVFVSAPGRAEAADNITTLATAYQPTIMESIDASGFRHPGVGVTKAVLDNMRTQVQAQQEPWNTHFNQMLLLPCAAKDVTSSNRSSSDPGKPASYAFNSQSFNSRFIADGLKAYTQAILYYVTGAEQYRANAMAIIRIWEQMDPAQYAYFSDAHIHTGIPLNRMVTAAEILRYTSTENELLRWTDEDTAKFTANLIMPVVETFQHSNQRFMNQHLYPLLGAMAGYVFTGNRTRYNEGVEWFTVNRTANDQGQNGAIKQLFRLVTRNDLTDEAVTPVVQHVEMGRDQAHGAGDITNMAILARLLIAQGTKVDPVNGTASSAANAVGPYEFLNDRILDATEYFSRYMLGYDTPWVPTAAHTDSTGTPTIVYKSLAPQYRGRLSQNTWEPFYYYRYVRGIDLQERAPYFSALYEKRVSYNWDGVDGGGDFWLFIPEAAAAEGAKYLVKPIIDPKREVEDRFSAFDANAIAARDSTAAYTRLKATTAGTTIAIVGYANDTRTVAFRIRTNGTATMDVFGDTISLPNTKGQWKYTAYPFDEFQSLGHLVYVTIKGPGTTVDIDHINLQAGTLLTPPAFTAGAADMTIVTYTGSTAAINYTYSATDPASADVLTYQIDNAPSGAVFNTGTGAFSWKPTQAGTYSFMVSVSDGSTVTTRNVKVIVATSRQSAVAAASASYDANTQYAGPTLTEFTQAYDKAVNAMSSATDAQFAQMLASLTAAVQGLKPLTPLLSDGSMDYSRMFVSSTFTTYVPRLLDDDANTCAPSNAALTHIMDFGPSFKVSATAFQAQARASFPDRMGGATFFGSNDSENWIRITPDTTKVVDDMQTLPVRDDLTNQRFRFLKMQAIYRTNPNYFEVGELRILGARHDTVNRLSSVSIGAADALRSRIGRGSTVKLTFRSTAPINNVAVQIQGQKATVTTSDSLNWTATAVMGSTADIGKVKFLLNYRTAEGVDAEPTLFTTDGTWLFIADQTDYIGNLLDITTLSDSNGRSATDVRTAAASLFDRNLSTVTEFRLNGSGSGAWLAFDFKTGNTATLSRVEIIGRQDQYASRIGGTVIQGSNDKTNWTTISNAAASTAEWQILTINSTQPYRYIRVYNPGAWFGNMAELRMYGAIGAAN